MISFIMLVYERTHYFKEAFDSLRAQGVDLEVVVHDSSAVSVASAVEEHAHGLRFTYLHAPKDVPWPPFIGRAWNRAIDLARGDFIAFLDDDDTKDPAFSRLMLEPLADPSVDVALCSGRVFDENGLGGTVFGAPLLDRHKLLTTPTFITTGQLLVRRRVFDIERFDHELPVSEDYDFSIRLCAFKNVVRHEALAYHRVSGSSLSLNRDVSTPTQVALRHLLTRHGAFNGTTCTRCGGPLEPPPDHVNGGWHWFIRNNGKSWDILCGKDKDCGP